MIPVVTAIPFRPWRKGCRCFLAFSWLSGMLCGFLFFISAKGTALLWMRGAPYSSVSIVRYFCVALIPVLLSVFAVFLSAKLWLLLICFIEAFLFFFVSIGFRLAFGSSGWLIQTLLMFGQCISLPVLYWYWLRRLSAGTTGKILETAWVLSLTILFSSMHTCVISPILAELIEI